MTHFDSTIMRHYRIYPLLSLGLAVCLAACAQAGVTITIDRDGNVRIKVDGDSDVVIDAPDAPGDEPRDTLGAWPEQSVGGIDRTWLDAGSTVTIEDTLIDTALESESDAATGLMVRANKRDGAFDSLIVRDVVIQGPPTDHGAFVQGVREVIFERVIIDMRGRKPFIFDHGLYLTQNEFGKLGAKVTFRHCVFAGGPGFGVKIRSDQDGGFDTVTFENCVFLDCPEAAGFKPDPAPGSDGAIAERSVRKVVFTGCVFLHSGDFAYPEDWQARKLVRLYRAESFVFTDNVSVNTPARADRPDAIATAAWPGDVVFERNRHIEDVVAFDLPGEPREIKAMIRRLR